MNKENRYNGWIVFLYLLIAFLFGVSVAVNFLPSKRNVVMSKSQVGKMNQVLQYINQFYVDSVDVDTLCDQAISYILQSLDPHSAYASPEQNKAMMESLEGSFEGVGIQFNIMNDTVMVVATVAGGPAEKVGIRAGDRIVTVDGKSVVGTTNDKIYKALRGQKGTKVKVGVRRQGMKDVYVYEVKRDKIPTYTVDVSYMVNKTTGYVKITEFGSTTTDEFVRAILKLKGQGMQSMIVDLRGNAGGFLDAAIGVCDEMLSRNQKIVSVEGLKVRPDVIKATRKGNFLQGKVVILIDDFSASASEIVAGAIQDNDRGYVVGRRSFGKGLVQRQFDLSDKSTIRLTTARYHTPSGRCIQRDYKGGTEAYYEDVYKRLESGELVNADNVKMDTSDAYKTVGGRTVYGGGGIMPDYFVPLDTTSALDGYYTIANTATLVQYAFHYATNHKSELKKLYPDADSYVSKMTFTDAQLKEVLQYYTKLTNKKAPVLSAKSQKEVKLWAKALIGRDLYGNEAFYPVVNSSDKTVLKALDVLKK